MKVVHFVSSLTHSAGGLFYALTGLAQAQAARGVDVGIVGGADEFFDADRHLWGSVHLHPYRLGKRGYGLTAQAVSHLRQVRPDLVHIHGIWSANSIYGRAATLLKIPTVVSPHGMLDPWILRRRPLVKKVHAALFERPLLRCGHLHALNEAERDASLAFMPDLDERVFVVPNGIPPVMLSDAATSREGTLFLGRLHSKKQVLELIDAWQTLGLSSGERLTIAGWGDPAYEGEVREAINGAANVEFVGPLHGAAKTAALMRARFFILPSLSEGLPMAVLEAIQHGCIPVITEQCNLPELFRDGIAFQIAADFSDFERVMTAAFAMPHDELCQLSFAASAYAERYLWPTIASSMVEQYDRILRMPGQHPSRD